MIINLITRYHYEVYSYYGITYGRCDLSTYESVFIFIDNRYFEIVPSTYIISFTDTNTVCAIGFADGGTDWLLGDVFLRNFYSVWDDDSNKLSLAPHIYS